MYNKIIADTHNMSLEEFEQTLKDMRAILIQHPNELHFHDTFEKYFNKARQAYDYVQHNLDLTYYLDNSGVIVLFPMAIEGFIDDYQEFIEEYKNPLIPFSQHDHPIKDIDP